MGISKGKSSQPNQPRAFIFDTGFGNRGQAIRQSLISLLASRFSPPKSRLSLLTRFQVDLQADLVVDDFVGDGANQT